MFPRDYEGRIRIEDVNSCIFISKDMEDHDIIELVSYEEIQANPGQYIRFAYDYPEIFTQEVMDTIHQENLDAEYNHALAIIEEYNKNKKLES